MKMFIKTRLLRFVFFGFVPAVLPAGEPVTKIEDLHKPQISAIRHRLTEVIYPPADIQSVDLLQPLQAIWSDLPSTPTARD
jgi:hypothetical protein